jgi:pimeloyl-ACP methyl ester carboxylesterase
MLATVLEKYGPVEHFVAHSFGGLAIAHTLEKMLPPDGARIALIAPATETSSAIDRFFRIFGLGSTVRRHFDDIVFKKGGYPLEHYSIRRAMKNFRATILWIHDETDKVTPISDALKVRDDGYPDLEFVVTNGLGHRRIYKDPEMVKKVVSFIAAR